MTTVILIALGLIFLVGVYGLCRYFRPAKKIPKPTLEPIKYDFSKLNSPVVGKYAGRVAVPRHTRYNPYVSAPPANDSSFTDGLVTALIVEDILAPSSAPDTSNSFGGFGGGDFGGGGAGGSWDSSSSTSDTSSSYDSGSSSSYDSSSSSSDSGSSSW